jgi:hypothetical protein
VDTNSEKLAGCLCIYALLSIETRVIL